jgi:hypothetical protein
MLRYKISIITIAFLIFSCSVSFAQWQKTNGPTGAFSAWVAASGQNAYVGIDAGNGGVYSTTDNGGHWSLTTSVDYFAGMVIDGNNYFALIGPYNHLGSIWISNDAGKSWNYQIVNPNGGRIYCLYGNSTKLFAGTDSGAFASTDAGKTWSSRRGGITDRIYSITQSGSTLFAGSWSTGLYTSTNDGVTWTNINSHIANAPFYFSPISTIVTFGNAVFAGSQDGVFRTGDDGAHWNYAHAGLGTDTACYNFSTNGSVLLMWSHINTFLYQWNDASNSWTKIFDKGGQVAFGANAWFLTGVRGVLVSTDNGSHWTQQNNGIVVQSGAIAVSGGNLYCDMTGYMFVSTDQGGSWPATYVNTPSNTDLNNASVVSMSPSGSDLIASISHVGTGDIVRITNQGKDRSASILGANTLFTNGPAAGILDLGSKIVTCGANINDYVNNINYSGIFISADGGQTFTTHNSGLADTLVLSLATDGINIFAGTEFGKLYKSTDQGTTWTFINQLSTDAIGSIAISGGIMFYSTYSGFYVTKDYGTHSVLHNEGLGTASIRGLAVDTKYIYASTDTGVQRRPLQEFLDVSNKQIIGNAIVNCYPNPVITTTTLIYSLGLTSHITYSVIDVLGRSVWSSDEGEQTEGIHLLHIDANRWSAGSYQITFFANGTRISTINIIK